jgi:hypothetical protein
MAEVMPIRGILVSKKIFINSKVREQDITPLNLPLELNYEERNLMLFIWRAMYSQLRSPEMKEQWIKNQGKEDYELAVKNYKGWIYSLEREGYMPGSA